MGIFKDAMEKAINDLIKNEAEKSIKRLVKKKPVFDASDRNLSYLDALTMMTPSERQCVLGKKKAELFEIEFKDRIDLFKKSISEKNNA